MKRLVRITKEKYDILKNNYGNPQIVGEVIVDCRDCPDCDVRSFILMCIRKTIDRNLVCNYSLRIDAFKLNGVIQIPYYNLRDAFQGYLVISVSKEFNRDTPRDTLMWIDDSSGGHISRLTVFGDIYLATRHGQFAKFCETYDV